MELLHLPVGKLRLNPHNDRHGPLRDETAAIYWLLENRANHMRALAADLAQSKRLFALPLVRHEQDDFVVFDGIAGHAASSYFSTQNLHLAKHGKFSFQRLNALRWRRHSPSSNARSCRIFR